MIQTQIKVSRLPYQTSEDEKDYFGSEQVWASVDEEVGEWTSTGLLPLCLGDEHNYIDFQVNELTSSCLV